MQRHELESFQLSAAARCMTYVTAVGDWATAVRDFQQQKLLSHCASWAVGVPHCFPTFLAVCSNRQQEAQFCQAWLKQCTVATRLNHRSCSENNSFFLQLVFIRKKMVNNTGSIELFPETLMGCKEWSQLWPAIQCAKRPPPWISFFAFITHFSRENPLVEWEKTLMLIKTEILKVLLNNPWVPSRIVLSTWKWLSYGNTMPAVTIPEQGFENPVDCLILDGIFLG